MWKRSFCHDNLSSNRLQWNDWPDTTYPDINYVINTPSFCTREQLKAYKSTDGYNFFCSCCVGNLTVIGNQIARPKVLYLWL